MTEYVFASATSRRGAARTDVGGNISKLQLNPHQLMSQGCDSQAETTWREGDAAPACPARTAWTQAAQPVRCFCIMPLQHQPCKANRQPAVLAQEQAAAVQGHRSPPASARGSRSNTGHGGHLWLQCPSLYELLTVWPGDPRIL